MNVALVILFIWACGLIGFASGLAFTLTPWMAFMTAYMPVVLFILYYPEWKKKHSEGYNVQ